jgi:hypothetical protein
MIAKLEWYKGKTWEQINNGTLHSYDCFCDLTSKSIRVMDGNEFERFFDKNRDRLSLEAWSNLSIGLLFDNVYQFSVGARILTRVYLLDGKINIVVFDD